MDTQLSRFWRSTTARPCRSSFAPFDGTISSERVAPPTCTRRAIMRQLLAFYVSAPYQLTGVARYHCARVKSDRWHVCVADDCSTHNSDLIRSCPQAISRYYCKPLCQSGCSPTFYS